MVNVAIFFGVLKQSKGTTVIETNLHSMLSGAGAAVGAIGSSISHLRRAVLIGEDSGFWMEEVYSTRAAIVFTAVAGLVLAAAVLYTTSGRLKSPWSQRKRKHQLTPEQWDNLFTSDGRLRDNGIKFLKKVRSGGIDVSIRAEVWPFLLGVFDLTSTEEERGIIRTQKRKEYKNLRKQCAKLFRHSHQQSESNGTCEISDGECGSGIGETGDWDIGLGITESRSEEVGRNSESFPPSGNAEIARQSVSNNGFPGINDSEGAARSDGFAGSEQITDLDIASDSESSDSESSDDPELSQTFDFTESTKENDSNLSSTENSSPSKIEVQSRPYNLEDYTTWQRIIRLDAIRANGEWIPYSLGRADVSDAKARHSAEAVGLKDYDHLDAIRIYHATRLVSILEAYALYDPEIGYCQGMSDLLSPIVSMITEDYLAFWCFVGFMKKARHNFRLDEVGIRRQLNIVSKIIKYKDSHLYRHLVALQAEDCFFVYRMVVVLFRRELTFEQTLCLWEVMWADQAAIRAGIGKSAWSRIRQRAPPTDDLLLYAISASVLQRRKQIIEKYSSMDEILRECNAMAGHLDVWKLLDDAHDLVVTVHDRIETSL